MQERPTVWYRALIVVLIYFSLGSLPSAHSQDAVAKLAFDVATIRASEPNKRGGGIKPTPGGDGYIAQNMSVRAMIGVIYGVPAWEITGGPTWLESQRFDIQAKSDQARSIDDLHEMFKELLASRFKLKFHIESKVGPIYALVVQNASGKLTVDDSPQKFSLPLTYGNDDQVVATAVSMPYFCVWLSNQLRQDQRPVVDQTGLSKKYDFVLPPFAPPSPLTVNGEVVMPPGQMDRPTLFRVLRDQLGLRLDKRQGPVNYFRVDSLESPSDN